MCLSPFQTQTQQMYIQTQPHDICIFIIKWLFQRHPLNMDHALESQKWIPSSYKKASRRFQKQKHNVSTWEIYVEDF